MEPINYKYKVTWNRGDDEGQEFFKTKKQAKSYAKSVHGQVYTFKLVKVIEMVEQWYVIK